jgi:hypothetical protein
MTIFITVYYSGVVITNKIGSYEFVGMKNETFLLNGFWTLTNMVHLVREQLGWMDEGCEVQFEVRIDIGSSNDPQMKTMSPVYNENEWTTYIGVMIKSEIYEIELVARMVIWNNVGDESSRSPTLPEAVDKQHVECDVVLTQPSQKTQDNTDAEESPFIASNETMLNVEPVYKSVGVGDVVADTGFISSVDSQPIATGFALYIDLSFITPKFILEYEAVFGDECAEDSVDDRPVPKLNNREKALLQRALAKHVPEIPDCRDLSHAHMIVADGLRFDDSVPVINLYVLTCRRGCPGIVHARKGKDGS